MPYVIDRQRALLTEDIVAVVASRQRRIRSRVVLKDNSLYQTLTRPATVIRSVNAKSPAVVQIGARGRRRPRGRGGEERGRPDA